MGKIKKALNIFGTPVCKIKVGERALIAETNGSTRQTSVVKQVREITDSKICFETQNTFYTLFIRTVSLDGAAVQAKILCLSLMQTQLQLFLISKSFFSNPGLEVIRNETTWKPCCCRSKP